MEIVHVRNLTSSFVIAHAVEYHADRGLGLMFRHQLSVEQGVRLDMDCTTRFFSAIHMLFVFFPIAVFWLDRSGVVVDKTLARPFHPFYIPRQPARFVLELHSCKLDSADRGDQLTFEA
jgi:uncharacterized membrane protein (UPF0127 family)